MFYGYCYKYNSPKFDLGSAIPCIDLAVQSLGETFQGDDGKYYQTDIIGDRDGEIRFGGVAVFNATRDVQFSANSGRYPSIKFTIDGTIGSNVFSRGIGTAPTDIVIGMSGTSLRFIYYNTNGSPKILTILNYNTVYGTGKHEIEYLLTDMGGNVTKVEIFVDGKLYLSNTYSNSIPSYNGDTHYIGSRVGGTPGFCNMENMTICDSDDKQVFKTYFENTDSETVFDISDEGNHGTLTSGSEIGFQTQEEGIYSYWDNYGGNYVSPNYIPALESNTDIDVLGNTNENKGRVKYPNEQWSSCLTTNGSTNYLDTEYYPNGDTVFIFKGSFDVVKANNYIGCGDTANDKRLYFGITTASGNNFIFGAGAFTTSDYPYDLEPHTFIVCARGEFFVLPIETDISTPAKVKDILDNTTPNGTSSGFTTASIQPIYLGGLSALGVFANTTNFESQILEYDGTDITLIDKWGFSEYDGADVYSLADGFDLEILGSLVDVWDLSPYAYPRNNTLGYSIGSLGEYIPASEIDPTKDVYGNDLQVLGTEQGLNGSESECLTPYVYELIQACNILSPNFVFDSGVSILWGYDDIEGNVQDLGFMFADVNTNAPVKDKLTTYSEALTGDCLAKANEYFKTT